VESVVCESMHFSVLSPPEYQHTHGTSHVMHEN